MAWQGVRSVYAAGSGATWGHAALYAGGLRSTCKHLGLMACQIGTVAWLQTVTATHGNWHFGGGGGGCHRACGGVSMVAFRDAASIMALAMGHR